MMCGAHRTRIHTALSDAMWRAHWWAQLKSNINTDLLYVVTGQAGVRPSKTCDPTVCRPGDARRVVLLRGATLLWSP